MILKHNISQHIFNSTVNCIHNLSLLDYLHIKMSFTPLLKSNPNVLKFKSVFCALGTSNTLNVIGQKNLGIFVYMVIKCGLTHWPIFKTRQKLNSPHFYGDVCTIHCKWLYAKTIYKNHILKIDIHVYSLQIYLIVANKK